MKLTQLNLTARERWWITKRKQNFYDLVNNDTIVGTWQSRRWCHLVMPVRRCGLLFRCWVEVCRPVYSSSSRFSTVRRTWLAAFAEASPSHRWSSRNPMMVRAIASMPCSSVWTRFSCSGDVDPSDPVREAGRSRCFLVYRTLYGRRDAIWLE